MTNLQNCLSFPLILLRENILARRFEVLHKITREYRRYNAVGRQLAVRLIPPSDNSNPVAHFLASVNDLFEHTLRDVDDSDKAGITIQNQVNQNDKPIGISYRRKDHLSADLIWSVFERLSQSNSGFSALDSLVDTVHSVKIPSVFVKMQLRAGADRYP